MSDISLKNHSEANSPKISIVTIVLNGRDVLEKTISSVICQTYDDIQYIVIDGASTDGTLEVIKQYEKNIDIWISENDSGIYDAMNKGFERSKGEWVLFLNAGDFLVNKNVVSDVVKFINKQGIEADLIYGDKHTYGKVVKATAIKDSLLRGGFFACHQSMFFRQDNRYNTRFKIFGDFELISRMYTSGKKFLYVNFPISDYDENGISSKISYRTRIEKLYCLVRYFGMAGLYNSYFKRIIR